MLGVSDITKSFGDRGILRGVTFNLAEHDTLAILGSSGCGKSTLLKIIAGILSPCSGSITLRGADLLSRPPQQRNAVYLFQEALLFPHLNVYENIAFGLRIRKVEKHTLEQKVNRMINDLALDGQQRKLPHQLSGGQKQRVAFGRALIIEPPLLLLDEPFSSLDVETRSGMQELYKTIAQRYNISALFVTHDLKEALIMGNRLAYMQNGTLLVYNSKQDFMNDLRTGVQQELSFWNSIKQQL